jgi:hypothetical protein
VLVGLLCATLGIPGWATEHSQPLEKPEIGPTPVTPDAVINNEALRQAALDLEKDGRFSEAIQKLRFLYGQNGDMGLLLDILRLHQHAGDLLGATQVYKQYAEKNPNPSAATRRQLKDFSIWAKLPLADRNRKPAPLAHASAEVSSGSGAATRTRPEARHMAATSERVPSYGPPAPEALPGVAAVVVGPPLPLTQAPAPEHRRPFPRWGKIVLGVLGSGVAATALGVGLGLGLNPSRGYTVYTSMAHK